MGHPVCREIYPAVSPEIPVCSCGFKRGMDCNGMVAIRGPLLFLSSRGGFAFFVAAHDVAMAFNA
eukprot:5061399-Pyramimonas_sp.AAC.1